MKVSALSKQLSWLIGASVALAVLLSFAFGVPYIFSLIGISSLVLIGHLVTLDDDMRGGWSNPDGDLPFPWGEILVKGAVLLGLIALAVAVPGLSVLGAR